MDVDLWRRLEAEAPIQRRSAGNLLQKLVQDGLDRLQQDRDVQAVQRNYRQLLSNLSPRELRAILARQEAVLARRRALPLLPDLPASLRVDLPAPSPPRPRRPRRRPPSTLSTRSTAKRAQRAKRA